MPTTLDPLASSLATVAFVDVVDSVQQIAQNELAGIQRIREWLDQAALQAVPAHGGRVAERRGDGLVLRFEHCRDALRCVAALHDLAAGMGGAALSPHPGLRLRAGLHHTAFLDIGGALYGAGVNLAARIAALAQPGDTLMSVSARDELVDRLDGPLEDLGPCWFKGIDESVRVFRRRGASAAGVLEIDKAVDARMKLLPTLLILVPKDVRRQRTHAKAPIGLADVVAHQLTQGLSPSTLLHVISPLSAQAVRGLDWQPQQLYQSFRADYVLCGELTRGAHDEGIDEPLHLNLELWRKGSSQPIWAERFERPTRDLLSADSELVGRIVHAVSHRILHVEQRAASSAAALPSLASHTLHLNAVDMLHRFAPQTFERAHDMLVSLHERAPRYATPLAWLARWHVFRVVQGWSDNRQRDNDMAMRYSERALDIDPNSSLALTMAGSVHAGVKRDAKTAQSYYALALKHNPNDSLAWLMSSVAQGFMNDREHALSASEQALGLAPADPTRHYYDALSATAALRAQEYGRCIQLAQRAIQGNATHGTAYRSMAIAQAKLGLAEEARDTVTRLLAVEPHCTVKTYLARVPHQDSSREHFAQLLMESGLPAD